MIEKTSIAFGKAVIINSENVFKNILEILQENQCFGQVLRQDDGIVSEKQLRYAVEQTTSAFANEENFAKKKEIELLLRISGRKQLPNALALLGFGEGKQNLCILVVGEKEKSEKALQEIKDFLNLKEHELKPDFKKICKSFGISPAEQKLQKNRAQNIENAVLEKIALLSIEN